MVFQWMITLETSQEKGKRIDIIYTNFILKHLHIQQWWIYIEMLMTLNPVSWNTMVVLHLFQGYEKSIRRLFERAGLYMSEAKKVEQKKKITAKEEHDDELETGDFHSLDKCSKVQVLCFLFSWLCHYCKLDSLGNQSQTQTYHCHNTYHIKLTYLSVKAVLR